MSRREVISGLGDSLENQETMATNACCAECGEEGGVSLKTCKACMHARYCSAVCQRNHWPKHKTACKLRAAELRDKALFKDPPPKEDCPICFLPMPATILLCASLPPATTSSVPIYDYAIANDGLEAKDMEVYYSCCGKSICSGCILHPLYAAGYICKCPFCNAERNIYATDEDKVAQIRKRVEANDAGAMYVLGTYYDQGLVGLLQDREKAIALWTQAAERGSSRAHFSLGRIYHEGENLKKAKFHWGSAAMAGHDGARCNLGSLEYNSGKMERAIKHWTIAASAGSYFALRELIICFQEGSVTRESIDSTLAAYNSSCAEMRSEARDSSIRAIAETI